MCDTTKTVKTCQNTEVEVDECIARFVQAFNDAGITTSTSCCGHGKSDASFLTYSQDEYRLVIIVDAEQSREVFKKDYQDFHSYWEEVHKEKK